MKKAIFVLVFLAVALVFVAGCAEEIKSGATSSDIPTAEDKETKDIVVAEETGSEKAEETKIINVEIKGFAFNPGTITIKKGTTVRWTQKDSAKHTVTSDEGIFNSNLLRQDETFSHTFNEAGTFQYHCAPHPYMKGKVIVE